LLSEGEIPFLCFPKFVHTGADLKLVVLNLAEAKLTIRRASIKVDFPALFLPTTIVIGLNTMV